MGRYAGCVQEGLKKGPWTQEEDEKLITFVTEHGYGNWRVLPKRCGLLRCGKSCRLRWNNYLRPDIKRGQFTQSEEQQIIQLHALVGNKWSFIASQLPKRTDNEIKNYWNTVLRKRIEKVGLRSFLSVGAARTDRPGERQSQENNGNNKNSSGVSEKASCSNSVSVNHLAQWESARLEAEMRLAKESQASKKAHKLFSFAYKGHSFSASNTSASTTTTSTAAGLSSFSNHAVTDHQYSLPQLSTPFLAKTPAPTICDPSLIPPPSILSASSLSLPDLASMIFRCSASGSSSTPSNTASSSLPSQESIGSALTLGPNGILSWQTKELSFTTSPCTSSTPSQSSLISQMLCQIDGDHGQEDDIQALAEDAGEVEASRGCHEQLNLEATSSMMDLNSTMGSSMDLRSNMENWHDLMLDGENNSCSAMVSTNGKGAFVQPVSAQREEFTHDSSSSSAVSSTTKPCPQGHGSWELEGLNLFHFDSLVSCEHQTNVLMKELFWDTALSTSSTSIVN